MPARLPLLALALLLAAGCDSGDDEIELDADFYVGTWTLVGISDGSGDRTAEVLALLDDFTIRFDSDRDYQLDADFNGLVNAAGQPDVSVAGDYQAVAATRSLVLRVDTDDLTVAAPFTTEAETEDAVSVTANGALIEQLLGSLDVLDFEGDVTLDIERR